MREPDDSADISAIFASWSNEEDQRGEQQERLKQLFANAKDAGYNTKALRAAFKEHYRLQNQTNEQADKRAKTEGDVELYLVALARVPAHVREDNQSTAARKDVQTAQGSKPTVPADLLVGSGKGPAGTQAPPVDTPSQLEETQRQGESEQRRDDGSQPHEPEQSTVSSGDFQREPTSVPPVSDPPRDVDAQRSTEGTHSGPEIHASWLKSTVVPIRKPVTEAPKQDRTKPHPDCLDPAECGLSSWEWFCSRCKKAAEAKRAGAA